MKSPILTLGVCLISLFSNAHNLRVSHNAGCAGDAHFGLHGSYINIYEGSSPFGVAEDASYDLASSSVFPDGSIDDLTGSDPSVPGQIRYILEISHDDWDDPIFIPLHSSTPHMNGSRMTWGDIDHLEYGQCYTIKVLIPPSNTVQSSCAPPSQCWIASSITCTPCFSPLVQVFNYGCNQAYPTSDLLYWDFVSTPVRFQHNTSGIIPLDDNDYNICDDGGLHDGKRFRLQIWDINSSTPSVGPANGVIVADLGFATATPTGASGSLKWGEVDCELEAEKCYTMIVSVWENNEWVQSVRYCYPCYEQCAVGEITASPVTITLTASGGVTYQWSNGSTSPSITVPCNGTQYWVTPFDANGCAGNPICFKTPTLIFDECEP